MKKIFIFACAALLLVAFTAPAMAKLKIGGIIFTDFYYEKRNAEGESGGVAKGATKTDNSYSGTRIQVPNITRFNMVWTNEDNVGMRIESSVGDNAAGASGSADMGVRHAYGWWDATPQFQLMVGHSTTPFSPLNPNQLVGLRSNVGVHIIGAGYGEYYSGRWPQVRFTFKVGDTAKIAVALSDPSGGTDIAPAAKTGAAVDNDSTLPRIDIGVPLTLGPVKLYPSMFYHKQTYDDVASGNDDEVVAYGYSLGLKAGFGPVSIAGEIQIGQNWDNSFGLSTVTTAGGQSDTAFIDANGKVKDADCLAYWLQIGFKAGPATIYGIWGQASYENERASGSGDDFDTKSTMYGIHVLIPVAKTFNIRPEIMFYDDDDGAKINGVTTDYGKEAIYGICFQVAF